MLICITNRKLCKDDFLKRIDALAKGKTAGIMLREKDLSEAEYEDLAIKVKEICDNNKVTLIVNQNIRTARNLGISHVQLSMPDLRAYKGALSHFSHVGASVHSVLEAKEAQELGASYLVAGHIFPTECKKGVPPRGLPFLQSICHSVTIPVFAIGGITKDKVPGVLNTGAKGYCIMSEAMTCKLEGQATIIQ